MSMYLDCTSESVEKGLAGAVYKYEKEETETNLFLTSGEIHQPGTNIRGTGHRY